MIQNLWDTAKAVLRGKFIAIQSYLRKQEKSQIDNLTLHLKQPEKEEETKPKGRRRKEIKKIRAEINEIEAKKREKISETKSWFFDKINKIDKPLAGLIEKKIERAQINKFRNEKGDVITNTTEIQKIRRDYYKQLYIKKTNKLEETDKFLEMYNLPRLNQEEIENTNRPFTSTVSKNQLNQKIGRRPK